MHVGQKSDWQMSSGQADEPQASSQNASPAALVWLHAEAVVMVPEVVVWLAVVSVVIVHVAVVPVVEAVEVTVPLVVLDSVAVSDVCEVVPLTSQKPQVKSQRWACSPQVGQKTVSQSATMKEQVTRQSASL